MYFSYEKGSMTNMYPLSAEEVKEIIEMNRDGEKPESLIPDTVPSAPEFVTAVGDDSITRFDEIKRGRRKKRHKRRNSNAEN